MRNKDEPEGMIVDPETVRDTLTDKEEMYCQLRGKGFTKSQAAQKAYDTVHPSKIAYQLELKPEIIHRIWQLKEELREVSTIDLPEQLRRYNELYLEARNAGKIDMAKRILERMDKILGFESPTKTISIKTNSPEVFQDIKGDVKKDIDRFKDILGKHSKQITKPAEKSIDDGTLH